MVTDLVAAWRQFRRSPPHVVIVVVSLGVGMAVSLAAFSVTNLVLPASRVWALQTLSAANRRVWYSRESDARGLKSFATGGHVTPAWFEAIGAPLIAGRGFERPDMKRGTAIVNEGMAATLAADSALALRQRLRVSDTAAGQQRSVETVQMAADHLTLPSGQAVPAIG